MKKKIVLATLFIVILIMIGSYAQKTVETIASVQVKKYGLLSLTLNNSPVQFPDTSPGEKPANAFQFNGYPLIASIGNESTVSDIYIKTKTNSSLFVSESNKSDVFSASNMQWGDSEIKSLVSYYPLDRNANDDAGNNHGSVYGAVNSTGKYGRAYEFDGVDDYIKTPIITTKINNVSLSAWIKWNGRTSQNQNVIYQGQGGSSGYGIVLIKDNDFRIYGLNGGVGWISSGYLLDVGQWYYVVMVRDNGVWKMYVDGKQITTSGNPTPNQPTDSTYIGANFKGSIDEVKIWNRALTAEEINSIYSKSTTWTNYTNSDDVVCKGLSAGDKCEIYHRLAIPLGTLEGNYKIGISVTAV